MTAQPTPATVPPPGQPAAPLVRSGRGYDPMPRSMWDARTAYLRQALARLKDPALPEPSIELLAGQPHGPFTSITAGTDPETGHPAIYFTVQNADRGPRYCPPEVFLMLDFLLAFGGGVSVNDNGGGWAYVRPWSGDYRHTLGRLVANARAGEVVKQNPRADHHAQHPQHFTRTGGGRSSGRPEGTPRRTREDAISTALGYFDRNHHRSAIAVSHEDYLRVLRDAFRLVDAYHAAEPEDGSEAV